MSVSRKKKKPPRKRRVKRRTAAPSHAAPGDPIASAYAAAIARTILAAAVALASHGFTGRKRLINHLRGNQLPRGERGPGPGFAVLESHATRWVEEAVDRLIEEGLLTFMVLPTSGGVVGLSPSGRQILEGGAAVHPGVLPRRPRLGAHPEAEARLRDLRRAIAADERRPAFSIFPNDVLAALAERRPASLVELAEVPGLGAPRIGKYGKRILAALGKT